MFLTVLSIHSFNLVMQVSIGIQELIATGRQIEENKNESIYLEMVEKAEVLATGVFDSLDTSV